MEIITSPSVLTALFQMQPKLLLAFFCCKGALLPHVQFSCPPGLPGVFWQSCFPAIPKNAVAPPQTQDFALPFVELHEVPVSLFLQLFKVSYNAVVVLWIRLPWVTTKKTMVKPSINALQSRLDKFVLLARPQQSATVRKWAICWQFKNRRKIPLRSWSNLLCSWNSLIIHILLFLPLDCIWDLISGLCPKVNVRFHKHSLGNSWKS